FSIKPLRMFSIFGLGILALTALLALLHIVMSFVTSPPRGITTVLLLQLINLGVFSLGIGILGEYIAKIYAESKRRPLWLVDYTLNLEGQAAPGIVSGLLGGRDEFGPALAQHRPAPSSSSEAA